MEDFYKDASLLLSKETSSITKKELVEFFSKHKQPLLNYKCFPFGDEIEINPKKYEHTIFGLLTSIERGHREFMNKRGDSLLIETKIDMDLLSKEKIKETNGMKDEILKVLEEYSNFESQNEHLDSKDEQLESIKERNQKRKVDLENISEERRLLKNKIESANLSIMGISSPAQIFISEFVKVKNLREEIEPEITALMDEQYLDGSDKEVHSKIKLFFKDEYDLDEKDFDKMKEAFSETNRMNRKLSKDDLENPIYKLKEEIVSLMISPFDNQLTNSPKKKQKIQ